MEYRLLGGSGLKVSALSFGTGTFGGTNEFFKAWGCCNLKKGQVETLDKASERLSVYPYWHQRKLFSGRNPLPV